MQFKLIMVFVDDAKTDVVLDAAREAGATGATIIPHARGQGKQRARTFFGLEFLHPRTILLILVEARRAAEVMAAVTDAGGLDETANTGIALELEVTSATGLSEHIRLLASQHPIAD